MVTLILDPVRKAYAKGWMGIRTSVNRPAGSGLAVEAA
jgi:hypothetical protein